MVEYLFRRGPVSGQLGWGPLFVLDLFNGWTQPCELCQQWPPSTVIFLALCSKTLRTAQAWCPLRTRRAGAHCLPLVIQCPSGITTSSKKAHSVALLQSSLHETDRCVRFSLCATTLHKTKEYRAKFSHRIWYPNPRSFFQAVPWVNGQ